jgi:hypothetical protein
MDADPPCVQCRYAPADKSGRGFNATYGLNSARLVSSKKTRSAGDISRVSARAHPCGKADRSGGRPRAAGPSKAPRAFWYIRGGKNTPDVLPRGLLPLRSHLAPTSVGFGRACRRFLRRAHREISTFFTRLFVFTTRVCSTARGALEIQHETKFPASVH